LKGEAEMNIKIDTLTKRLDTINVGQSINATNTFTVDSCSICEEVQSYVCHIQVPELLREVGPS
jgi:hypothetical protein